MISSKVSFFALTSGRRKLSWITGTGLGWQRGLVNALAFCSGLVGDAPNELIPDNKGLLWLASGFGYSGWALEGGCG